MILIQEIRIQDEELIKALNSERLMNVANDLNVEIQFRKHPGASEMVAICKEVPIPTTTEVLEIAAKEIDEAVNIIMKTAEEIKNEHIHFKKDIPEDENTQHPDEDDEELEFLQYAGLCALSELLKSHVILLIPEAIWEEK